MSEWHIPENLMATFSSNPGAIHHVTAASIEQHLTRCRSCQADLAGISPRPELDAIWAEIEDGVDRAGVGLTERLLRWLRVESGLARLIAATPALRVSAVAAAVLIVAALVFFSRFANVDGAFLVLAPLVPTALVAVSFAPGVDPAGECGLATPMFGFALVIRRAVAVEVLVLLVLAIGSLFIPIDGPKALGWLVPALALSLGTIAGSVWWSAPRAAGGLTMGWATALVLAYVAQGGSDLVELAVFDPPGQTVLGLMAAASSVVMVMNRQVLLQEVNQ